MKTESGLGDNMIDVFVYFKFVCVIASSNTELSFRQGRQEPVQAPGHFIALGPSEQSIF